MGRQAENLCFRSKSALEGTQGGVNPIRSKTEESFVLRMLFLERSLQKSLEDFGDEVPRGMIAPSFKEATESGLSFPFFAFLTIFRSFMDALCSFFTITWPCGRGRGEKKLETLDRVNMVIMIAAMAFFALTIVFLGLSQASYMPPLVPLYSFSAFVVTMFIPCGVDRIRQSVADKHGIDLQARDKPLFGHKKEKKGSGSDSDD